MVIKRFAVIATASLALYFQSRKLNEGTITRDEFGLYLKRRLERLGPTFIKVGQILSLRPDLIPLEYCMPLRDLLDKTPEMRFEEAYAILKRELGVEPSKVFSHISNRPVASASLAQVYKAQLRGTKEYVAIKIKKSGVEKLIKADVLVLKVLNFMLYRFIRDQINSAAILSDLENLLDKEVDFVKEGTNVERFKENFKLFAYVRTPDIYWQYTTHSLLIMEFIPGVSLNRVFEKIDHDPELRHHEAIAIGDITIHKRQLAHRLIQVTAHSVFDTGFFHADPHPANIILTPDNKIAYIDFGMVGDLLSDEKILFRELVFCISTKDEERMYSILKEYNRNLGYGTPDPGTAIQLKHYIHDIINDFVSGDQRNFPITKFMYTLGGMAFKFHFPPPPFLMLISKQIFTLEGLSAYLIPDLNVIKEFHPYVRSFRANDSMDKFSSEKIAKLIDDTTSFGLALPETLSSVLDNMKHEGMIRLNPPPSLDTKPIFYVCAVYALALGVLLSISGIRPLLIIIIWMSIITVIVILYVLLYTYGTIRNKKGS